MWCNIQGLVEADPVVVIESTYCPSLSAQMTLPTVAFNISDREVQRGTDFDPVQDDSNIIVLMCTMYRIHSNTMSTLETKYLWGIQNKCGDTKVSSATFNNRYKHLQYIKQLV